MLKALVNLSDDGPGMAQVETGGDLATILAELTYLTVALYQSTKRADDEAAWLFKDAFVNAMNDASVWNMLVHGSSTKDHCTVFKPPKL